MSQEKSVVAKCRPFENQPKVPTSNLGVNFSSGAQLLSCVPTLPHLKSAMENRGAKRVFNQGTNFTPRG
jgi:hypothetical protein